MIESSCQLFACIESQIELELVAVAPRGIWPRRVRHHRAAVVDAAAKSRLHTRGAVEKPRKLSERDWPPIIEAARRVARTQELRRWRDCLRLRGRELAQMDPLSGPAGPHRRQRSHDPFIRINSAQRVGVSPFRAARVE